MKRTTTPGNPSRFWRGDHHVRRLRLEALEQRQLLAATVLESRIWPSLANGSLASGVASLTIPFSETVLGALESANYRLQSAGFFGLLGAADDVVVPIAVSYAGTTPTLTFAGLPSGVYRLMVFDTITDVSGNRLDGNSDGVPGGDWVRDFVVAPPPAGILDPTLGTTAK